MSAIYEAGVRSRYLVLSDYRIKNYKFMRLLINIKILKATNMIDNNKWDIGVKNAHVGGGGIGFHYIF